MATGAASEAERERERERESVSVCGRQREREAAAGKAGRGCVRACVRESAGRITRASERGAHTTPVLLPPNSQSQAAVEDERDLRSPGGVRRHRHPLVGRSRSVGRWVVDSSPVSQSVSRTIAADVPTVGAEEEEFEFRLTTKQERARARARWRHSCSLSVLPQFPIFVIGNWDGSLGGA